MGMPFRSPAALARTGIKTAQDLSQRMPSFGITVVRGRSMEPTYHDGDRLVVAWGLPPRIGHPAIVALPSGPDGPRPLAVKRVTGRDPADPSRWWVERDSDAIGVDSWTVGSVAPEDIKALVLTRLPQVSLPGGRRAQAAAIAAIGMRALMKARQERGASRGASRGRAQRGKLD